MTQENRSPEVPTRSDANQAVHPQKIVRGLKFQIKEVQGLFYLLSENKGADQYASLFSHMHQAAFLMTWLKY